MARTPPRTAATANSILNRTAAEVGVGPVSDPMGSADPAFIQLQNLLNTAGDELALDFTWEALQSSHQIVTQSTDSGEYPLPDDFNYMINQTGWERAENVPLFGPLSPQDWTYLLGRDLVAYTIYASFRLVAGTFNLFPVPPPSALDVHFEYMSKNWVQDGDDPLVFKDEVTKGNDIPMYHRTLLTRFLRVKYYEAKFLDSTKAQDSFNQIFVFLTGLNQGAEVLSAGRNRTGYPYLDTYNNTPDTNYGSLG